MGNGKLCEGRGVGGGRSFAVFRLACSAAAAFVMLACQSGPGPALEPVVAPVVSSPPPVLSDVPRPPLLTAADLYALPPDRAPHRSGAAYRVDLSPAKWIWFPSQRTLPNTFVLFRRVIPCGEKPRRAAGWIAADSRYRLTVNGRRVQWGPAPCDPRWLEVDPVDIADLLVAGTNVLGVEALYYGQGDGTWPGGKPGLLFHLRLDHADGRFEEVVSDASWQAMPDRAHPPGRPQRWFIRALQEEFDARLHPHGWDTPAFATDARWTPAAVVSDRADRPVASGPAWEYLRDQTVDPAVSFLRARQTPLLREVDLPTARLADSGRVVWKRDPADWFDFRAPGAFAIPAGEAAVARGDGAWDLPATPDAADGAFLTFELPEQAVGWPYFTLDAPAGTVVELMTQEGHDPGRTRWLDTHFFSWSRFICREGENRFEAFDYDSVKWLQLHVRHAARPVVVRNVGLRRRVYPWPQTPRVRCAEPALQRLFDACRNTLANSCQETIVDGMGRERQQYSGDCGHQLHAVRYAFGDALLGRRYLRTFSEGQTPGGYFLDCWPAIDRLVRVSQRQIDATMWGPILDHGIGFNFDCWNHFMETGDRDALREPYPRLLRFAGYLASLRGPDGLLPVEGLGIPSVWLDHLGFERGRHKQCAFNLYAAAMLRHALAPLARELGEPERAARLEALGRGIEDAAAAAFWDAEQGIFIDNRPWLAEEKKPRLHDRTLATALLFDQCPGGRTGPSLEALASCPRGMGLSYPPNAIWRCRALARHGRVDVVLRDFRTRWAGMASVAKNNAIQEMWESRADAPDVWSHCGVVPLAVVFMDVAGIQPLAPGFARVRVRPQLGDLPDLDLTAHTPRGPIGFRATRDGDGHRVTLTLPADCPGELWLPEGAPCDLPALDPDPQNPDLARWQLDPGRRHEFVTR